MGTSDAVFLYHVEGFCFLYKNIIMRYVGSFVHLW